MKSTVIKLVMLLVTCITFSNCDEGCSYINNVDEFDLHKIVGEWYTIMRWKNGVDKVISCTKTTVTEALKIEKINYWPDNTTDTVFGSFDAEATCKAHVVAKWPPKIPSKVVVIYIDYENVGIVQACFENTEYLWVFTREKYPCKNVLKKIDEVIKTNKLDRHEIFRQCKS